MQEKHKSEQRKPRKLKIAKLENLTQKNSLKGAGFLWERVGKVVGSVGNGEEVERSGEEGAAGLARESGAYAKAVEDFDPLSSLWHLEELHMTWTEFRKKRDKLATLHDDDHDLAYNAWRRHSEEQDMQQMLKRAKILKAFKFRCTYARKDFHAYTGMEPQLFKETILKNYDFIENYMIKTIIHAQTIQKRLDDKKLQIQECTLQEVKALDAISEDKAQEHCMTFTSTMFLHMDQLEKQLDKEEFQKIGSMAAFKVLKIQFQMFIKSRIYLMMNMVNERRMQTSEEKADTNKALDASLFDTKSNGTESLEQIQAAWKPVLQPHRNQSVVRQLAAFNFERPRSSNSRFASQVDMNNDLPKPVTTHYFPKGKESACAKPHHMIAHGSSRRERLTSPNDIEWMRNLRFTLRYENKEYVLDEKIPTIDDDSTEEEIEAHQKHYDDANKVSCIMVSSMSPKPQETFKNTWAYEMNQQLKEVFQAKASKERLDIAPTSDPKEALCFYCNIKGHWKHSCPKYLKDLKDGKVKKGSHSGMFMIELHNTTTLDSWVMDTGCGTHICTVLQGLKESRRLKYGELNLVIRNRKITLVIRIGKYELMRNSGVRIDLNKCYYSSEMIRNIILFHALFKDGYKFSFDNENRDILVYLNGCFMFKASPYKAIYETVKCIAHNGNVILNVGSCERGEALLDLVHTYACGPFRSATLDGKRYYVMFTDDFSRYAYVYMIKHKSDTFEVFKRYQNEVESQMGRKIKMDVKTAFLNGKMTEDVFMTQPKDLVHTYACGPFRSATLDGKRYYVMFTDDFSRYAYVYMIKHKSDTFEVFKRYQNEVESQMGRKIKMWKGKRPSLGHIKIWGCEIFVRREAHDKLEAISRKCLFIDYREESFGYLFYNPNDTVAFVARRGVFIEIEIISKEDSGSMIDLEEIQESVDEEPIVNTDTQQEVVTPVELDDISLPIRITSGRMDVKTAFLNGKMTEDVFMTQPKGFENAKDLGVVPIVQDPIEIFCDNKSAVALTKEPKDHRKSKHIERKYHFVRSKVKEGYVIVKHIRSKDNPTDPFIKALAESRHDEHAKSIGLKDNIKF
uniref:Retroviral polymerase SH3-like domain-containing protein n=1 Tax=Tanacetum cinerariifolium TaxID=118510 RepID=A0A6L2KT38_TANCI|nr:hypothetical protein [Tanacetum cinerariifolium]